jgi:hypothetical protein
LLFVRPRISISHKGKLISAHAELLHNYITHFLVLDAISLIILLVNFIGAPELSYLRLFFYLKIFTFRQITHQIYVKVAGWRILRYLFGFFKVIFLGFFFTFVCGSIFVTIDLYYYYEGGYYYQNGFLWITSPQKLGYTNLY